MDYHLFLPMLIAFLITVLISPAFIPLLRKLKFGQYVREDGPESHLKKAGTPTMGGIVMILAFGITCIPYMFREPKLFPIFFLAMGFGVIGLLDDGIKILMKHSEGLLPWQKLGLQFLVTILFLVFLRKSGVDTQILIPFTHGQMTVDLGIMFYPFAFIAILGTVNGANFTDGLDGLGAGVTEWITISFMENRRRGRGQCGGCCSLYAAGCPGRLPDFQYLSGACVHGGYRVPVPRRMHRSDGFCPADAALYSDCGVHLSAGDRIGDDPGLLF